MAKYYYKPIKDVVLESYKSNSGSELSAPSNFDEKVVLIVEADSEEIAEKIRIGITDIRMWENFKSE
jgi:hypothetical protein